MLVEEFCDFVEDVDLEVKLGLQSKFVHLIERPDLQKIRSNQKEFGISEGLGDSSLSGVPLISEIPKPPAVMYTSQYAFGQKPWGKSVSQNSNTYPAELLRLQEVSKEPPHSCKACVKLGYYQGPPAIVCVPTYVSFGTVTDYLLNSIQWGACTRKSGPIHQRPQRPQETYIKMIYNHGILGSLSWPGIWKPLLMYEYLLVYSWEY